MEQCSVTGCRNKDHGGIFTPFSEMLPVLSVNLVKLNLPGWQGVSLITPVAVDGWAEPYPALAVDTHNSI